MLLRWPEAWAARHVGTAHEVRLARGSVIEPPVVTELRDVFHTLIDAAVRGRLRPRSLARAHTHACTYGRHDVQPQAAASGAPTLHACTHRAPPTAALHARHPLTRASPHPSKGLARAVSTLTPPFDASDGRSMLCLLRDPTGARPCDYAPNPGPWRAWVELEHSTCYNATNHWSALTDGRLKYVYRAWIGDEQLFNLTADPHEAYDLARVPTHAPLVAAWRARLVGQFETEGRGVGWVDAGRLVVRTKGQTYSPNYPGGAPPAGAELYVD